jgi:sigma-B regulation protein RsbU (phosphoserine phosphatase)
VNYPLLRDDRRFVQLRSLTELSRALTSAVSFEQVMELAVDRAANLLGASAAVLMLADEHGRQTIRAATGLAVVLPTIGHSLDDALVDELQRALGVSSEQFLAVPLVVGGEVTGLLAVALPECSPSSAEDREWLLSALADQVAVALEKSRLDERGRFRDRLIGIVSHDLRNPLNTIALGTSALLDDSKLDAYAIKTLTRIQSAADRAERMIRDLLDYTQAHLGGGIPVDRSANDVGLIAQQVADEVEIAHPQYELHLELVGDTRAYVDVDRIAQMLGNLTSNAVNYSPPGTRVHVSVRGEQSIVVITVHNQGTPIPSERLRDIFEPMQQVSPGTGRSQRSVGLGLYIVESIVTSHGGTIVVSSSADEGTTFTVKLPRDVAPNMLQSC